MERDRRWTDWWRRPKVGGFLVKYVKPLYCKYLRAITLVSVLISLQNMQTS